MPVFDNLYRGGHTRLATGQLAGDRVALTRGDHPLLHRHSLRQDRVPCARCGAVWSAGLHFRCLDCFGECIECQWCCPAERVRKTQGEGKDAEVDDDQQTDSNTSDNNTSQDEAAANRRIVVVCSAVRAAGATFHVSVTCNSCGQKDFSGKCYRCFTCPNMDFCDHCFANGKDLTVIDRRHASLAGHTHRHKFLALEPGQDYRNSPETTVVHESSHAMEAFPFEASRYLLGSSRYAVTDLPFSMAQVIGCLRATRGLRGLPREPISCPDDDPVIWGTYLLSNIWFASLYGRYRCIRKKVFGDRSKGQTPCITQVCFHCHRAQLLDSVHTAYTPLKQGDLEESEYTWELKDYRDKPTVGRSWSLSDVFRTTGFFPLHAAICNDREVDMGASPLGNLQPCFGLSGTFGETSSDGCQYLLLLERFASQTTVADMIDSLSDLRSSDFSDGVLAALSTDFRALVSLRRLLHSIGSCEHCAHASKFTHPVHHAVLVAPCGWESPDHSVPLQTYFSQDESQRQKAWSTDRAWGTFFSGISRNVGGGTHMNFIAQSAQELVVWNVLRRNSVCSSCKCSLARDTVYRCVSCVSTGRGHFTPFDLCPQCIARAECRGLHSEHIFLQCHRVADMVPSWDPPAAPADSNDLNLQTPSANLQTPSAVATKEVFVSEEYLDAYEEHGKHTGTTSSVSVSADANIRAAAFSDFETGYMYEADEKAATSVPVAVPSREVIYSAPPSSDSNFERPSIARSPYYFSDGSDALEDELEERAATVEVERLLFDPTIFASDGTGTSSGGSPSCVVIPQLGRSPPSGKDSYEPERDLSSSCPTTRDASAAHFVAMSLASPSDTDGYFSPDASQAYVSGYESGSDGPEIAGADDDCYENNGIDSDFAGAHRDSPSVASQPAISSTARTNCRSWNEEYQHILSMPATTDEQRIQRYRSLLLLTEAFESTARMTAVQIVDELALPPARKTIAQVAVGGVAGGDKFISNG